MSTVEFIMTYKAIANEWFPYIICLCHTHVVFIVKEVASLWGLGKIMGTHKYLSYSRSAGWIVETAMTSCCN